MHYGKKDLTDAWAAVKRRTHSSRGIEVCVVDVYPEAGPDDEVEDTGFEDVCIRFVKVSGYIIKYEYHLHKQRVNGALARPETPSRHLCSIRLWPHASCMA